MPERVTKQLLLVLEAFLSDTDRDWYGFDLIERTGLKSGTIYPLLHGLKEDGWLSTTKERIDPGIVGRPARRLYRLTRLGEGEAISTIEQRAGGGLRRTAARIPRLRPAGASV